MKNTKSNYLHKKQIKKKSRRKTYYIILLSLAAIVVFTTVYSLILPAITMEKETQVLNCALNIHQHTEQCYDSEGNLTCGEADVVIHSHDDNCYDKDGNLACKLPQVLAHKHSNSCYNKKGDLICTETEVEEHTHTDECYDKDGTLICGKLNTIKHVHDSSCFTSTQSTEGGSAENGISTLSDTSGDTNSSETTSSTESSSALGRSMSRAGTLNVDCGYNKEDGSIWWGDSSAARVAKADIKEGTQYVISGVNDNNVMSDQTITIDGKTYLKATLKRDMGDYTQYECWCFEKAAGTDNYYVYFLKTNEDGSTTKLYLHFTGEATDGWQGNKVVQTALTDDKAQANVFTMTKPPESAADYQNHIILKSTHDGIDYYVNSDSDDNGYGATLKWIGYTGESIGNYLIVSDYGRDAEHTAKRVSTDTSINSIINLFDYWITPNQTDSDSQDPVVNSDLMNSKINNGHDFKFTKGTSEGSCKLNYWTQAGQLPRQGIVSNNLVDRYPVLSGNNDVNGTESTESLRYLFDPEYVHEGKESFENVGGLLKLDDEGYYSYDCFKNMAEFDEKSNYVRLYDKPGVTGSGDTGQFFPFNKAPEIMAAGRQDEVINHYFGMTLTTRFVQRYDGFTDEKKGTPTTFHFSGDDDVWIFIDDVLVGDVGGIHDAASIDIDFSTGKVKVGVVGSETAAPEITLKECFERAGKTNTNWNGNTFENSTMHTLKFFYLERGNNASNMSLKFNLNEIPVTALEKSDEYGEPVEGAKFAFYAAKGDNKENEPADDIYHMVYNKGSKDIVTLPDEYSYAENGDILDSSGNTLAEALYVGTTDSEGRLELLDADGMPYSIEEIEAKFGNKFILREIGLPETYRQVGNEIHLKVFEGESQKVIVSDNTEDSGARALTDLRTTATDTIYLREKNQDPNINQPVVKKQQYCDPHTGKYTGTMFSVVVKCTGETYVNENGDRLVAKDNVDKLLTSTKFWTPLYGDDENGYKLVDMTGKDFYTAAIEAAQKKVEFNKAKLNSSDADYNNKIYEGVTLQHQTNGTMQLYMDDLPGHIRFYYNMLPKERKNRTRYTVFYFWTDKSSLEEATANDTYLVNTRSINYSGIEYSGFDRVFSAVIDVPNLVNDVYVQKVDENHNLIDGATFAMYRVEQQENGEIHYLASDGSYRPLPENAKPNKETGVIQGDGFTISPPEFYIDPTKPDKKPAVDTTHDFKDGNHYAGTVRFVNIPRGQYIIKEIKAPPGYKINTNDVMFMVTDYTAYANAGVKGDGIIVGRGPGYLVKPMHALAPEDDINNTLTWIYARMRVSQPSTSFADIGDMSKIRGYITKNNLSDTVSPNVADAFRANLMFAKGQVGAAFNYVPDPDRNPSAGAYGYRRIFTDTGWPYYEIYQDYDYGLEQTKTHEANKGIVDYYNWSEKKIGSITNLFSRTTYVRVIDKENDITLEPKKVDSSNAEVKLSGAQFRLYRLNAEGAKEYYVKNVDVQQAPTTASEETTAGESPTVSENKKYVESVSWSTEADKAFVVTTGADGLSITPTSPDPNDPNKAPTPNFTELKNGTYYLEEIKAPNGYALPTKSVELKVALPEMTGDPSSGCTLSKRLDEETNAYTYTITVPNSTGYELPATGGSGTIIYTAGGMMLILISLVCGYRQKRRCERRFK